MNLVNHRHSKTVNSQKPGGASASSGNYVSTSFDADTRSENFEDTVLCPPGKTPLQAWSGQDWSADEWQLPVTLTSMPQTLGIAQDLLGLSQHVGPDPVEGDFVVSCHGPATLEVQMDPCVNGSVYFVLWKRTATAESNYSSSRPYVFKAGTPVFSKFGPVREVRKTTNDSIEVRVPVPRIGVRQVRQPAPEVFDSRKAPAYMR